MPPVPRLLPRWRWAPRSTGTVPARPPPRAAALPTHAPPRPRWDADRDPWSPGVDAAAPVPNSDSAWRPAPAAHALLAPPPPAVPSRPSVPPPASPAPVTGPRGRPPDGDEASPA